MGESSGTRTGGARWLVQIEGASMLAPYLSDLGVADPDGEGHVFGAIAEAHVFGSEQAAQAWLDAHPKSAGWVVEVREVRQGTAVLFDAGDAEIARLKYPKSHEGRASRGMPCRACGGRGYVHDDPAGVHGPPGDCADCEGAG